MALPLAKNQFHDVPSFGAKRSTNANLGRPLSDAD
jgi:hypothetical protein